MCQAGLETFRNDVQQEHGQWFGWFGLPNSNSIGIGSGLPRWRHGRSGPKLGADFQPSSPPSSLGKTSWRQVPMSEVPAGDQPRSWLLVGAVFSQFQQKCLGISTWNHLESLSTKIQLSLGPGTQWGLPWNDDLREFLGDSKWIAKVCWKGMGQMSGFGGHTCTLVISSSYLNLCDVPWHFATYLIGDDSCLISKCGWSAREVPEHLFNSQVLKRQLTTGLIYVYSVLQLHSFEVCTEWSQSIVWLVIPGPRHLASQLSRFDSTHQCFEATI